MQAHRRALFALLLALALPMAHAKQDEPPVAGIRAGPATPGARFTLPAGTELVFEMGESVNSKTSQRGDWFSLRLAEPAFVDGQLLIPAGAPAMGQVVHADRARAGGKAGELILAARYLEWDGRQLPLSGFRPAVGKDRSKAAAGVAAAASVAGFLVRGGQSEVPAGSLITTKLRETVELPAVPEPAVPAPPDTTEANETNPGEYQP